MKKKIKNQKSKIKNKTKNLKTFLTLGKIAFLVGVLFFLLINIFSSQIISPLFFSLINEDKKAVVSYLKNIRQQDIFFFELEKFKNIYGKNIEKEVFDEENQQKSLIKQLEQILQKNPQARDVLYSLFKLYQNLGDQKTAQQYLQKAKEIDPLIINK